MSLAASQEASTSGDRSGILCPYIISNRTKAASTSANNLLRVKMLRMECLTVPDEASSKLFDLIRYLYIKYLFKTFEIFVYM